MKNHLKLLLVVAVVAALFSSCKKSPSDSSILEGHKWSLTAYTETYSDSAGVSHNLMPPDTICVASSYTQYESNATNSVLKLAYTYITDNCPGQYTMPDVGISSWNIDPDNTALYLNGDEYNGNNGEWFTIQSLTSSSMVLTIVNTNQIFPVGGTTPTYHTVTDTWTYTAQ
jgi:hypothetical protein